VSAACAVGVSDSVEGAGEPNAPDTLQPGTPADALAPALPGHPPDAVAACASDTGFGCSPARVLASWLIRSSSLASFRFSFFLLPPAFFCLRSRSRRSFNRFVWWWS
jgi:hypothetical protein